MKSRWIVVEEHEGRIIIVARCRHMTEANILVGLTPYRSWIVDAEGWAALSSLTLALDQEENDAGR